MAQNVGTPDWQRGIATPQKLLAAVAGGTGSVIVAVPPNAESLVVFAVGAPGLGTLSAYGEPSNIFYPIQESFSVHGGNSSGQYFINVSGQVDTEVLFGWSIAPGSTWYVYSDQAPHISFDPNVGQLVQERDSLLGLWGVLALGSDTVNQHVIETDSHGRLIPLVPTLTTGAVVMTTSPTQLVAAPASGAWYLFGVDFRNDSAARDTPSLLDSTSAQLTLSGVAAGGSDHVDLKGYRTTGKVQIVGLTTSAYVTLRYAPGP